MMKASGWCVAQRSSIERERLIMLLYVTLSRQDAYSYVDNFMAKYGPEHIRKGTRAKRLAHARRTGLTVVRGKIEWPERKH